MMLSALFGAKRLSDLSEQFETREQLNTLGAIVGCDAVVFTAGKIKKFMEADPQYHFARRIRKSHGPLRRSLSFLFEQGFVRKRSNGRRIVYEVKKWKTLEDYYHQLLWATYCFTSFMVTIFYLATAAE